MPNAWALLFQKGKYMKNVEHRIVPANLGNLRSSLQKGELNVDANVSLLEFVELWLKTFKKNKLKAASYNRLLISKKALEAYDISKKQIGDIDFFDIQNYINELVEYGYSISGLKKQIRIVTAPLKKAAAIRIINADPSIGIELPIEENLQKQSKDIIAYDQGQQDRLFAEIQKNKNNTGYLAVVFMIETGVRSGELLALKWKDIQLDRSRMHVHATIVQPSATAKAMYQDSPKTKSSNRIIPLTPRAKAILNILKENRQTEWVFEGKNGRYSYKQLMYQTKKLCRVTKVPYYGEHVFRHTFATNCYYKGVDVKILSRLMGHSSVTVTYNTYISLYGDGFDDMYAALCL